MLVFCLLAAERTTGSVPHYGGLVPCTTVHTGLCACPQQLAHQHSAHVRDTAVAERGATAAGDDIASGQRLQQFTCMHDQYLLLSVCLALKVTRKRQVMMSMLLCHVEAKADTLQSWGQHLWPCQSVPTCARNNYTPSFLSVGVILATNTLNAYPLPSPVRS